jgi:hypothetical protein
MLPEGSQERSMSNLSFARIMYGTNEDHYAPRSMSASTFSTRAAQFNIQSLANARNAFENATLGQLLRKAWTTLTGKS